MRELAASKITEAVARLCQEANFELGRDVYKAIEDGKAKEESPVGKEVLDQLLENARIASAEKMGICQDTGFTVVFLKLGQEVHVTGGGLNDAINEGVRRGYKEGYLRKSILSDPIERKNTGDNTPAIIHVEVVPGDGFHLVIAPKGGGSENMSKVGMLAPSAGAEGVKNFIVETASKAGSNPCPPIIVGAGIGGTFEIAALNAKKALLRDLGSVHPNPFYAAMEKELLERINKLGIGPAGLGGRITALGVHVMAFPCHIASLSVAVNIQCHAARHKEVSL